VKERFATERNMQLKELIVEIEHKAKQRMSLAQIATALNDAGYTTARGKQFTKGQICRIKNSICG